MNIRRIEIHGLRGFAEVESLDLAIPRGTSGSGLTIIVGPNNAGKSTIIEAFSAMGKRSTPPSFTRGKRNMEAGDQVRIRLVNTKGGIKGLKTITAGSSETVWEPPLPQPPPIESTDKQFMPSLFVVPSRRAFPPYFSRGIATREEYITNYAPPEARPTAVNNFYVRLFNIQRDPETRKVFTNLLRRVFDDDLEWTIDQEDTGQYFMKLRSSGSYHSSEGLGEGLISLIFLIDALYDSNSNDVVVVDEPELSLHPSLQRKLYALLAEYAATRQIIIATHSPYFVGADAIVNGAKVVRVTKRNDRSALFAISDESAANIKRITLDTHNPHSFGLETREVFFLEEHVILVEGQEDVVYYRKIAEQLGISLAGSFYGWGVGGAEKMEIIGQLLSELGFEHVVGILDENKEHEKPRLEAKFPRYSFFVIPANDVRSKPGRAATQAVEGLVTHNGVLQRKFRAKTLRLLKSVNVTLIGEAEAVRPCAGPFTDDAASASTPL